LTYTLSNASAAARVPANSRANFARLCLWLGTIRGRILVAFLAMSVITGTLGVYSASGIRRAGFLVAKTYDNSLM
jgi:hypothetical protein